MRNAAILAAVAVCLLTATASAQFSISGTVTDPALTPVAGVELVLSDTSGTSIGLPPIVTDASGFYSISPLPPGGYVVGFEPLATTGLVAQEATAFITGANVTLDVALQAGVLISGVVTDTTGTGIFNIDLKATDRDTKLVAYTPHDNTDSTGAYAVVLPGGRYDIKWRAVAVGALPWIDVEHRNVQIAADTTFDITMLIGVFVSGVVRDPLNVPIANVNLDYIDNATGLKLDTPGDNTDLLGQYQVHVPTGSYTVRVKPLAATGYLGIEVPDVTISGDTAIDYSLQSGALLSGTVTGPGAVPVFNVDVEVEDTLSRESPYTPFSTTDLTGAYAIVVPPGTWDVAYQPDPAESPTLAPAVLGGVSVPTNTVQNVTLVNGVVLSGSVIDVFSAGVPGVDIDAVDFTTGLSIPISNDATNALGVYSVVIAPGTYTLDAEPVKSTRLPAQRFEMVTVSADTTVSFFLQQGVMVRGYATDSLGTLLESVDVDAFEVPSGTRVFTPGDDTDATGYYEIVVPISQTLDFIYTAAPGSGVMDTVRVENQFLTSDRLINAVFPLQIITGAPLPSPRPATALRQNYPNPFNPETAIPYRLASPGRVRLAVYAVNGALVRVLRDGVHPGGDFVARWDGRDGRGRPVATGVYFYRLEASGVAQSRKMLLVK